jgi:hypothetical protein
MAMYMDWKHPIEDQTTGMADIIWSMEMMADGIREQCHSLHSLWLTSGLFIESINKSFDRRQPLASQKQLVLKMKREMSRLKADRPVINTVNRSDAHRPWKPHRKPHHKTLDDNQRAIYLMQHKLDAAEDRISMLDKVQERVVVVISQLEQLRENMSGSWDYTLDLSVLTMIMRYLGSHRRILGQVNRNMREVLLKGHHDLLFEAHPSGHLSFVFSAAPLIADLLERQAGYPGPAVRPHSDALELACTVNHERILTTQNLQVASDIWFARQGSVRLLSDEVCRYFQRLDDFKAKMHAGGHIILGWSRVNSLLQTDSARLCKGLSRGAWDSEHLCGSLSKEVPRVACLIPIRLPPIHQRNLAVYQQVCHVATAFLGCKLVLESL